MIEYLNLLIKKIIDINKNIPVENWMNQKYLTKILIIFLVLSIPLCIDSA